MPESAPAPVPIVEPTSARSAEVASAPDAVSVAESTPALLRRNLGRIRKAYPLGPLPEERRLAAPASAWVWSEPKGADRSASVNRGTRTVRRKRGPAESDALGGTAPSVDASDSLEDARRQQPFAELVALETEAAGLLHAADPAGLAKLSRGVADWFERRLTPEGLLRSDPARTWSLFAAVDRLRLALAEAGWNDFLEERWRGFVESVIRTAALPSPDGWVAPTRRTGRGADDVRSPALSEECRARLLAATRDRPLQCWRGPLRTLFGQPAERGAGKPPAVAGVQSDEAAFAILRGDWSDRGAALRVGHANPALDLDFTLAGRSLLTGVWETTLSVAGTTLPTMGRWESTCWFADADSEYLELRRLLGSGLVLERQCFLSRRAAILLLADTVKSPLAEPLELTWTLPATGGTLTSAPPLTARRWASAGQDLRLLIPTLPADPLAPVPANRHRLARGSIRLDGTALTVSAAGQGKRLFLPMVFDWSPTTGDPPAPWSTMLITSDRELVPPTEGVAFRVPTATGQMVYHRTFGPRGRFAFLGYQTRHECTIVELGKNGRFKEWLLVD